MARRKSALSVGSRSTVIARLMNAPLCVLIRSTLSLFSIRLTALGSSSSITLMSPDSRAFTRAVMSPMPTTSISSTQGPSDRQ